jgi:hypothetical protein
VLKWRVMIMGRGFRTGLRRGAGALLAAAGLAGGYLTAAVPAAASAMGHLVLADQQAPAFKLDAAI